MSSQKGELTVREISAETMKMPEPIIEPATSIVASVSVSALTNSRDDGAVSAVAVVDVKSWLAPRLLGSIPPRSRAKGTRAGGLFPVNCDSTADNGNRTGCGFPVPGYRQPVTLDDEGVADNRVEQGDIDVVHRAPNT